MKKIMLFMYVIVVITIILSAQSQAGTVPPYVNYQGTLTGVNGPVTGYHDLSFKIYTDPDSTNSKYLVWGPQTFPFVLFSNGSFNVILGNDKNNKNITEAFISDKTYLEITVDNGDPILPRQQILTAPYAFNALHGVPVGTVVAFYGNTAPEGWLLCQGQAIPNEDKYQKLRELIGNNTPDLRGRTIVGAGQGDSLTERKLGDKGGEENHTLTINEMPSHTHDIKGSNDVQNDGRPTLTGPGTGWTERTESTGGGAAHNNMQPFFVLNYIIKY